LVGIGGFIYSSDTLQGAFFIAERFLIFIIGRKCFFVNYFFIIFSLFFSRPINQARFSEHRGKNGFF